MANILESIKKC